MPQVDHVQETLGVSKRRACRVLGKARSTQRHVAKVADDEAALTQAIIDLASQFGRYGYRRITALLRAQGWPVKCQACGADLAQGRAEGADKTTQARSR